MPRIGRHHHHVEALLDRLTPRCAFLGDVDAIAAQFEYRSGFTGAELDPPVRHEIECRNAFSDPSRMIVAWWHEHDAVAKTYALCALRARRQKHLRRRGMGILFQEMVFDLPRVVDANAVGELHLFERFAIDSMLSISVPGSRNLVVADSSSQREAFYAAWECHAVVPRRWLRRRCAVLAAALRDSGATMLEEAVAAGENEG